MTQHGFLQSSESCREALTKQTIEGLVPFTHRLGAATPDAIDGLRDTAVHGRTASERTRASTTIITLYLRSIKESTAQQYKKDKAARDATKSSAASKSKKSKRRSRIGWLVDPHFLYGEKLRRVITSQIHISAGSFKQAHTASRAPVSDDVPETPPPSLRRGREIQAKYTSCREDSVVEDNPPVETVPEIEITSANK